MLQISAKPNECSPSLILSDIKMIRGDEDPNDVKRDVAAFNNEMQDAGLIDEKDESPKAINDLSI